jgi:hypothetical protein
MHAGRPLWVISIGLSLASLACGGDSSATTGTGSAEDSGSASTEPESSSDESGSTDASTGDGDGDPTMGDGDGAPGDGDGEVKFDIIAEFDLPFVDVCLAQDLDLLGGDGQANSCGQQAPPESFDPIEEWHYPINGAMQSWVTPLVINWTDDNNDGTIDMCDGPDVILTAFAGFGDCAIHIIDGDYGNSSLVHDIIDDLDVHCTGNPAVGDIDNDGWPEIVAVSNNSAETLLAIDNDGTLMWESDPNPYTTGGGGPWKSGGVALHDLDRDGTYEILYNHTLWDNTGTVLWGQSDPSGPQTWLQATTAADLDGDDDLELITAFSAHDFDGGWNATTLWDLRINAGLPAFSIPQVADFDDDPDPEILFTSDAGYLVAEHDGTVKWGPVKPQLMTPCFGANWGGYMRAASIHDFDNDGEAEFAAAACGTFAIYEVTDNGPVIIMEEPVQDSSGGTGTTSFDFLGDGTAEPVYSDETRAWAWAWTGNSWDARLELPRGSPTYMEFPSVADVDNDGSAEILVPSADNGANPALVVFGDADSRWIQARRIFNQHQYHITHVNEDGTVPTHHLNNWEFFNTFRANSQIEGGALCIPAG